MRMRHGLRENGECELNEMDGERTFLQNLILLYGEGVGEHDILLGLISQIN